MRKPPVAFILVCALCALFLPVSTALAASGTGPPAAKGAEDAARADLPGPLSVTAGDALPLPGPDFTDALAATEYEDLWTVQAAAGQEIVVTMYPPASEDFDLCLWAPGTTDFSYHSNAVAISWHFSGAESIRYLVPDGASGTYYIDVWSFDTPTDASYRLTAAVQQPGADALPLPAMKFADALTEPAYNDLWRIDLAARQQLIVSMYPPGSEDFDLCLWARGTTDFSDPYDSLIRSMHYSGTESFKYIVPTGAGGTYYINVWSDGTDVSNGAYTLAANVQSPSTTAVRITPPAVPLRAVSGRRYTSYGTLRPLHYAGDQTVKVEWQKYSGGRWRAAGTMRPVNRNYSGYTRYKVSYSFYGYGSGSMRWRVRAIHLADQLHPRKASAWRYFSVKV